MTLDHILKNKQSRYGSSYEQKKTFDEVLEFVECYVFSLHVYLQC